MTNQKDTHTITPADVIAHWERLRAEAGSAEKVADLLKDSEEDRLLISLGPDKEPALLAGINPGRKISPEIGGRNMKVESRVITIGGRKESVMEIICMEEQLKAVFAELVVDVFRRVSEGLASHHAVERALTDFRRLLQREPSSQVSREQAIGLTGELLILKRLAKVQPWAWQAWNGPLGETHDFRSAQHALEIKTSIHMGEEKLEINGKDQLKAPERGLHLLYIILTPDPKGEVTVPMLAEEIKQIVDDEQGFIERLENAGFHLSEPEPWEAHSFSISSITCFEVTDEFPKLTDKEIVGGELPEGIEDIRYSISLSSIRKWQIPERRVDDIIENFLNYDD